MADPYWTLINRILIQGGMSTSYKPALLRALADYGASRQDNLRVSWNWLAKQFVRYYWPLAVRYRVRQATDPREEPVIVRLIKELNVKSTVTADQFSQRNGRQFNALVDRLAKPGADCCLKEVVPRLHNVRSDPPAIFYKEHDQEITLETEALRFLQNYHETLRLLAIGRWVKFTESVSVSPRLWEKIEGRSKRGGLGKHRKALVAEGYADRCFYCETPLNDEWEVDHFLPWVFVLEDKLWNLVPCCKNCNSSKSDKIPISWLEKIQSRNSMLIETVGKDRKERRELSGFREWQPQHLAEHIAVLCRASLAEGFSRWAK